MGGIYCILNLDLDLDLSVILFLISRSWLKQNGFVVKYMTNSSVAGVQILEIYAHCSWFRDLVTTLSVHVMDAFRPAHLTLPI
jgi:hypothetical protein